MNAQRFKEPFSAPAEVSADLREKRSRKREQFRKCKPLKITEKRLFRRKKVHIITKYVNFCNPFDKYGNRITDKPTAAFGVCSCCDDTFVVPAIPFKFDLGADT